MTLRTQIRLKGRSANPNDIVEVERLGREVFDGPSATGPQCLTAVRQAKVAGLQPRPLPKEVARVIATVATEPPEAVLDRLRSGLTVTSTQPADVVSLRALSAAPLIFPGDQPRGASEGGRPLQVADPVEVPPTPESSGFRTLRFRDPAHLRGWITDIVERSLAGAAHTDKGREIAATGVRRDIVTAPTQISFENGVTSQWVLMAYDGITRLSLCLAALLNVHNAETAKAARLISEHLVPSSPGFNRKTNTTALLTQQRRSYGRLVERYRSGLVDGEPNEDAVWVRQHLHLPIDLHIAASDPHTGAAVPLHPSMASIVADAHVGVTPWKKPDLTLHRTRRAVRLLVERDQLTDDEAERVLRPSFASGANQRRDMLRRGVDIVALFFGADLYDETKRALRASTGAPRLTSQQVMASLGPLICQPWGATRPASEAWSYGGVALSEIVGGTFQPTHPENYLDLVETALDPDSTSRLELAVAGGIALIADGLLSTTLVGGSGGANEALPFRGTIDEALSNLARTREGLTALAIAANHFNPLAHGAAVGKLPQVDMSAADRVLRDGAGMPVWTTTKILARQAAAGRDVQEPAPEDAPTLPATAALLEDLVARLPQSVHDVLTAMETIADLLASDDAPASSGLTAEDREVITQDLATCFTVLARVR